MKTTGPWDSERIDNYLAESTIPLRLANSGRTGWPLILSLWYVHLDGVLWCASQEDSTVVAALERDPRCAFEVAADQPPYRGVRGRGRATLDRSRGEEILRILLHRYDIPATGGLGRWLLSRVETEVAIGIEPTWRGSWDFTARMSDKAAQPD